MKSNRFLPAILLRFVWAEPPHCPRRPNQHAISEDIASDLPEHDDA